MKNVSTICFVSFLLFLLLDPVSGSGQSGLDIRVERPSRVLPEKGYTTFIIKAENRSDVPINVQIIRTVNEYPDADWEVSVCSPDICYDAEVDTLDPYMIGPGETGGAQVHVLAGDTGEARVVISFDAQDGSEPTLVELRAEIGELPEPSLFVRVDSATSRAVGGDTVEFGLALLNTSGKSLQPRLVRLERDYPDGRWSDFFCLFDDCSGPEVENLTVDLDRSEGAVFSVKMIAGMQVGETGEVEVMIDPGDGTEPTFQRFAVTVDRVLSVADRREERRWLRIFPNPTSGEITIESALVAGDYAVPEIRLVDPSGRDWSDRIGMSLDQDGIRLNLSSLPTGFYHLMLRGKQGEIERNIIKY